MDLNGMQIYVVHTASVQYRTEDGWEGTHEIPTFLVLGATEADAKANAARVHGFLPGMVYSRPDAHAKRNRRHVTSVNFDVAPLEGIVDAGTRIVADRPDGWTDQEWAALQPAGDFSSSTHRESPEETERRWAAGSGKDDNPNG